MLKMQFAEKARFNQDEIEGVPAALADGNAFSGTLANRDREFMNGLQAAMMNDDTGQGSSIAAVNARRLSGQFGTAAKGQGKDKGADNTYYMMLMNQMMRNLQEQLEYIDEQREEIAEKLETLDEIDQRLMDGNFNPAENKSDMDLMLKIDPDLKQEEILAMTEAELHEWVEVNRTELQERDAELAIEQEQIRQTYDAAKELEASGKLNLEDGESIIHEPFPVSEQNTFENPIIEQAAVKALGSDFDRHYLTADQVVEIMAEVRLSSRTITEQSISVDHSLNNDNQIASILSMDLNIKF